LLFRIQYSQKCNQKKLITIFLQLIARPIPKDSKAEEKFNKQMQQAELDSRFDLIEELRATHQNSPKVNF
jgi:hypothetical protein